MKTLIDVAESAGSAAARTTADAVPTRGRRRDRLCLPVLVYCGMCTAIISSLGVLLIPTIAAAQHVSLASAQWVLTVNLLVGAVSTPVLGRAADGPHPRRVLVGMLAAVFAGSVLAATAGHLGQLLVGRALQGFTYGIIPVTITLARRHLPAHKARAGVAALAVTAATGLGLGYPLTGLVAEHLDYRAAFWVAVAFSASALVLAPLIIPAGGPDRGASSLTNWLLGTAGLGSGAVVLGGYVDRPASAARSMPVRGFDLVGTALLAAGLGTGLLALSETSDWGWGSPSVIGLLASSAALLTVWARWELRTTAPLIRLDLLRHPDVLIANVAALGLGTSMYIGFAAVGQLAQTSRSTGYGLGLSVFLAGVVILPLSVGSQLANRVVGALGGRVRPRTLLPLGALFVTLANAGLAIRHDRMWELMAAMALFGFGIGSTFAAMPALIIGAVPLDEVGSATSFNSVLRVIGGSIGSAVTGAVLSRHLSAGLPVASGYRDAFVVSATLCSLLLVLLVLDVARVRSRR